METICYCATCDLKSTNYGWCSECGTRLTYHKDVKVCMDFQLKTLSIPVNIHYFMIEHDAESLVADIGEKSGKLTEKIMNSLGIRYINIPPGTVYHDILIQAKQLQNPLIVDSFTQDILSINTKFILSNSGVVELQYNIQLIGDTCYFQKKILPIMQLELIFADLFEEYDVKLPIVKLVKFLGTSIYRLDPKNMITSAIIAKHHENNLKLWTILPKRILAQKYDGNETTTYETISPVSEHPSNSGYSHKCGLYFKLIPVETKLMGYFVYKYKNNAWLFTKNMHAICPMPTFIYKHPTQDLYVITHNNWTIVVTKHDSDSQCKNFKVYEIKTLSAMLINTNGKDIIQIRTGLSTIFIDYNSKSEHIIAEVDSDHVCLCNDHIFICFEKVIKYYDKFTGKLLREIDAEFLCWDSNRAHELVDKKLCITKFLYS